MVEDNEPDPQNHLQIRTHARLGGHIHASGDFRLYEILPPNAKGTEGWQKFDVGNVSVAIDSKSSRAISDCAFEASARMSEFLRAKCCRIESEDEVFIKRPQEFNWPSNLIDERHRMTNLGETTLRNVQRHLKYHFDQYDLDESLQIVAVTFCFTAHYSKHFLLPPAQRLNPHEFSSIEITKGLSESLMSKIIRDDEPLVAMTHLHRAIRETNPRHRWIDATIAAELAVKEVLIRKVPMLRSLLERLPSPPPPVLYGTVLEEYCGEKSPVLKQIEKGASIRNKLVHSPKEIEISEQDAENYVKDIEFALLHLRTILFNDDTWLQEKFAREQKSRSSRTS